MDIRLALMTGIDIPVPELKIVIHQPSIKEISYVGEQEFFIGLQTLIINKNMIKSQDNSLLESTTNFQIFMTIMQEPQAMDKKFAVEQVFTIIFPAYKVTLTPRCPTPTIAIGLQQIINTIKSIKIATNILCFSFVIFSPILSP